MHFANSPISLVTYTYLYHHCMYQFCCLQPAGMLTFFILTKGKHPFAPADKYHEVESRIANNIPVLSPVNDEVALDMISSMLVADPTKRPTAANLRG